MTQTTNRTNNTELINSTCTRGAQLGGEVVVVGICGDVLVLEACNSLSRHVFFPSDAHVVRD